MVPGEEEPDAVFGEQTGALEQADDLLPEELLGGGGADVRHGQPLAGSGSFAAGDERVGVGVWVQLIPERLGHSDHPVDEPAPKTVAALEEVFPGALDVLVEGLEQRVQGRLGRSTYPICGCLHARMP